ncbi:hypothetical protein HDU96_002409 [Phlyctochytrium bullatum]|nr:hypothetical protein HDU96_002409 [Phlyctochytrium bullatum]
MPLTGVPQGPKVQNTQAAAPKPHNSPKDPTAPDNLGGGGRPAGLSPANLGGIVSGVVGIAIVAVIGALFFVKRVRDRRTKEDASEADSAAQRRVMPWDEAGAAPAAGSTDDGSPAPESGAKKQVKRKLSAPLADLVLPALVALGSPKPSPVEDTEKAMTPITSTPATVEEAFPLPPYRRKSGGTANTFQEALIGADDLIAQHAPTLPIVITDENGVDILSELTEKKSSAPGSPTSPLAVMFPEALLQDPLGAAEGDQDWPHMMWEWQQYQWALQWHEWQMKQRAWQNEVRNKFLEKEAKRVAGLEPKVERVVKVKEPRTYRPSPLSRPISVASTATTVSEPETEDAALAAAQASLSRSVKSTGDAGLQAGTSLDRSDAVSVRSKSTTAGMPTRSLSVTSTAASSLAPSVAVLLVTSPEWAAPADVVPCNNAIPADDDATSSSTTTSLRRRTTSRAAPGATRRTSVSSVASAATVRASSFCVPALGVPAPAPGEEDLSGLPAPTRSASMVSTASAEISVMNISSVAPDGTLLTTQTAVVGSTAPPAAPAVAPLRCSPEPEMPFPEMPFPEMPFPAPPQAEADPVSPGASGAGAIEQVYPVTVAHRAARKDELDLAVGDAVVLWRIFEDGFCHGYDVERRVSGYFPIECVGPAAGGN